MVKMYRLKRKELINIIDFSARFLDIRSYAGFCDAVLDISDLFSFEFVHVGSMSFLEEWKLQTFYTNASVMNNWSLYRYNTNSYDDPVCNMVSAGKSLLWWETLPKSIHNMVEGLPDKSVLGYSFSKPSFDRSKNAIISFGGEGFLKSDRVEAILETLCPHVASAYFRLSDMKNILPEILSERELGVVRWIRAGKTSWEISKILDISENTVNFHIKNIKRKLGATNRQHAVAIALANNLIS